MIFRERVDRVMCRDIRSPILISKLRRSFRVIVFRAAQRDIICVHTHAVVQNMIFWFLLHRVFLIFKCTLRVQVSQIFMNWNLTIYSLNLQPVNLS